MRYPELLCAINRRVNGDAAAIGHGAERAAGLLDGQSRVTQLISKLAARREHLKSCSVASDVRTVTDREPGVWLLSAEENLPNQACSALR